MKTYQEIKNDIVRGVKTLDIGDNRKLQFYYNNNYGKCTVILTTEDRADYSRNQKNIINKIEIKNFKGFIQFSEKDFNILVKGE